MFFLSTGAACAAPVVASGDEVPANDRTPQEEKLAKSTTEAIEKQFNFVKNPVYTARVETIVGRLKPYMERNLPYEVTIVDHEMINAFAIAGGDMYVSTGMLDFVKTDLELAGIVAHEMVHADRKHVILQMARNERMTLLALAAIIASKGHGAAIMAGGALQVAVMGAYSIDLEKEADARGIDALQHAGYNPVGMLTLQERLKLEEMKRAYVNPGIYQTHPDTDERIAAAIKYMEDRNIPVNRKYSLGVLRTSVDREAGRALLKIDGEAICAAEESATSDALFKRMAATLWDTLQLETASYDIRVEGLNGVRTLYIRARALVREDELPDGADSLDAIRENLHRVLSAARRNHPMADYYK